MEKSIITNVLSIESKLKGSEHSLLDLVVLATRYNIISGHSFISDMNPWVISMISTNQTQS